MKPQVLWSVNPRREGHGKEALATGRSWFRDPSHPQGVLLHRLCTQQGGEGASGLLCPLYCAPWGHPAWEKGQSGKSPHQGSSRRARQGPDAHPDPGTGADGQGEGRRRQQLVPPASGSPEAAGVRGRDGSGWQEPSLLSAPPLPPCLLGPSRGFFPKPSACSLPGRPKSPGGRGWAQLPAQLSLVLAVWTGTNEDPLLAHPTSISHL